MGSLFQHRDVIANLAQPVVPARGPPGDTGGEVGVEMDDVFRSLPEDADPGGNRNQWNLPSSDEEEKEDVINTVGSPVVDMPAVESLVLPTLGQWPAQSLAQKMIPTLRTTRLPARLPFRAAAQQRMTRGTSAAAAARRDRTAG